MFSGQHRHERIKGLAREGGKSLGLVVTQPLEYNIQYQESRIFDAIARAITTITPPSVCSSAVLNPGDNIISVSSNSIKVKSKQQAKAAIALYEAQAKGQQLLISILSGGLKDSKFDFDSLIKGSIYKVYIDGFNDSLKTKYDLLNKFKSQELSGSKSLHLLDSLITWLQSDLMIRSNPISTTISQSQDLKFKFVDLENKELFKHYFSKVEYLVRSRDDLFKFMFFPNDKIEGDAATISSIISFFRPYQDILKLSKYLHQLKAKEIRIQSNPPQEDGGIVHAETSLGALGFPTYHGISMYSCLLCNAYLDDYGVAYRGWHNNHSETNYTFPPFNNRTIERIQQRSIPEKYHHFKKDRFFQEHELSDDEFEAKTEGDGQFLQDFIAFRNSLVKVNFLLWYVMYKTVYNKTYLDKENQPLYQVIKTTFSDESKPEKYESREQEEPSDIFLAQQLSPFQKALLANISKGGQEPIRNDHLVKVLYDPEYNPDFRASKNLEKFRVVYENLDNFDRFIQKVVRGLQDGQVQSEQIPSFPSETVNGTFTTTSTSSSVVLTGVVEAEKGDGPVAQD